MSTPAPTMTPPLRTVKDLLLPGVDLPPEVSRAAGEVAKSNGLGDALARLTPIGLDILGARIGALLSDLLNVDVGGIVGGALTKNQEIADALRSTAETPGSEAVVPLADQTFESAFSPAVDIVVDGSPLASVVFDVTIATTIEGALIVVKGGRMAAVQAGRAHLSASLSCGGTPIASRELDLDLPGVLTLPAAWGAPRSGAPGSGSQT